VKGVVITVTRKVTIITDSAADLPREIALQRNIRIVPLYVTLGDDTFKDGVELTPDELYLKMKFDKAVPRTSQPSPEDFRLAFEESSPPHVLCLTISANLSGTLQSAELSKELLSESVQVTTYNTKNASLGEGLKVLIADDLALIGLSVCEIINRLDALKLRTIFTVDHLQYLERGGRISKAQATMAAMLDIKPILTMSSNGLIENVTKVRSRQKSIRYLLEQMEQDLTSQYAGYIALSYAFCPEEAEKVLAVIQTKYPQAKIVTGPIGAAIGSHTGPGCLALFYELK